MESPGQRSRVLLWRPLKINQSSMTKSFSQEHNSETHDKVDWERVPSPLVWCKILIFMGEGEKMLLFSSKNLFTCFSRGLFAMVVHGKKRDTVRGNFVWGSEKIFSKFLICISPHPHPPHLTVNGSVFRFNQSFVFLFLFVCVCVLCLCLKTVWFVLMVFCLFCFGFFVLFCFVLFLFVCLFVCLFCFCFFFCLFVCFFLFFVFFLVCVCFCVCVCVFVSLFAFCFVYLFCFVFLIMQ